MMTHSLRWCRFRRAGSAVSFHSLHVRYEDATSSKDAPFAIGLTLSELAAFTTDANGNRRFVADTSVQHKWLELRGLALYHHVS